MALIQSVHDTLEKYYNESAGQINDDQKRKMVSELIDLYDNATTAERGDILVPENANVVSKINKYPPDRYNIIYNWESDDTVPATRQFKVLRRGEKFDRLGPSWGKCVGEIEANGSYASSEERSIPYHLIENDVTDEPSYHRYKALQDITESAIMQAIDDSSNFTDEEKAAMRLQVQQYYNIMHIKYGRGEGLAHGTIAPMFGHPGGGKQYDMPLNMHNLCLLGLIDIDANP